MKPTLIGLAPVRAKDAPIPTRAIPVSGRYRLKGGTMPSDEISQMRENVVRTGLPADSRVRTTEPSQFILGQILRETVEGFPGIGQEPGDWAELADRFVLALAGRYVLVEKDEYDRTVTLLRDAKNRVVPTTVTCPLCRRSLSPDNTGRFPIHRKNMAGAPICSTGGQLVANLVSRETRASLNGNEKTETCTVSRGEKPAEKDLIVILQSTRL